MAVMNMGDKERPMADDEVINDREPMPRSATGGATQPMPEKSLGGGLFHLYKPGQGYWTRMGTAGASVLFVVFVGRFIYQSLNVMVLAREPELRTLGREYPWLVIGVSVGFILGSAFLLWWYQNKPRIVDFLIATETEMKKVNWTSRRELIGSTKVVILFMFLIAIALFVYDILFSFLFNLVGVLKYGPFS